MFVSIRFWTTLLQSRLSNLDRELADTFAALRKQSYDDWLVIESFSRLDPQFAAVVHLWRDMDPIEEIADKGLAFIRGGWEASSEA